MRAPELLSSCGSGKKGLPAGEGRLVMELRKAVGSVAGAEECGAAAQRPSEGQLPAF